MPHSSGDLRTRASEFDFESLWLGRKSLPQLQSKSNPGHGTLFLSRAMDWSGMLSKESSEPVGIGKFGEVYRCRWVIGPGDSAAPPEVAMKVFRLLSTATELQRNKMNKVMRRKILTFTFF